MLGLSANLNYYLFNGNVDLRKGIFRLCESIREEMSLDPSDASNVYMFMSRNRKVVKILLIVSAKRYHHSGRIGTAIADESVPSQRSNRYQRSA